MAVALELLALAARDQQHLGVGLHADHAVHHLCADGFELFRPVDVGLFVKTRLQFHHGRHFLAAAHCLTQQRHQFGVGAGAVDGLLDRQHVRIVHRLAQHVEHRLEALERLVGQNVALLQALENRIDAPQGLRIAGRKRREQEFLLVDQIDQHAHAHQVDRAMHAVQRLLRQVELAAQQVGQFVRAVGGHLDTHGLAVVALLQTFAQGHTQVAHILFIHCQVGMARDAELRELFHFAVGEQLFQMRTDHAGQGNQQVLAAGQVGRQAQQARQGARHLQDGDAVGAAQRITAGQLDDEVERLVGHLRERVGRVEADRQQQRAHLGLEVVLDPAALLGRARAVRDDGDTVGLQRRIQAVAQDVVLLGNQLVCLGRDAQELALGEVAFVDVVLRRIEQIRHADLEEFVQVGGNDGQVTHALEQRHFLARSPVEHAGVEGQNALVAIKHGGKLHGNTRQSAARAWPGTRKTALQRQNACPQHGLRQASRKNRGIVNYTINCAPRRIDGDSAKADRPHASSSAGRPC